MSRSNTVDQAVSQSDIAEKAVATWVNDEARPLLERARAVLNGELVVDVEATTAATGVATTIWTSETMPTNGVWLVEAKVLGFKTSGASRVFAGIRRAVFQSNAAVVAQVGATTDVYTEETVAGTQAAIAASGSTVVVQVTDDATNTFQWLARISVFRSRE